LEHDLNYYLFIRPTLYDDRLQEMIGNYLKTNISRNIQHKDLVTWFSLEPRKLTSISDIDTFFDLKDNAELKTVALVMNPYIRVFLSYIIYMNFYILKTDIPLEQLAEHAKKNLQPINLDDLEKNLNAFKTDPTVLSYTDQVDLYESTEFKPDIYLRFESIAEDLKQIDDLKERTDTNIFDTLYQVTNMYRDFFVDDSVRQLIEITFAKDFARYGYAF
jgi:hypothetical protein